MGQTTNCNASFCGGSSHLRIRVCSELSPGKSIREAIGQATNFPASKALEPDTMNALDLVITNALIVDWSGIFKVGNTSRLTQPC